METDIRPWGRFEVLYDGPECKVKRLVVEPGKRLSYQLHRRRREQWTVVSGVADVLLDGVASRLGAGYAMEVPLGAKHRVGNSEAVPLVIVEIQLGDYFGEDDIERFEDDYGRG